MQVQSYTPIHCCLEEPAMDSKFPINYNIIRSLWAAEGAYKCVLSESKPRRCDSVVVIARVQSGLTVSTIFGSF